MKLNLGKVSAFVLALLITGCNAHVPGLGVSRSDNLEQVMSRDEIAELDNEYTAFKTQALTQAYLKRKLDKWLSITNGPKLVKELHYARHKHGELFKSIMVANPTMYTNINSNSSVSSEKSSNAAFNAFLQHYGISLSTVTIAGTGITNTDANGTNAFFSSPHGVARDSNGNTYVADKDNHRIRKITAAGDVTTVAGTGTQSFADGAATSAMFSWPYSVAVDSSGNNLYVADPGNNRIRKIDLTTNMVSTVAGVSASGTTDGTGTNARFNSPYGITLDNSGNLFVSDTVNYRIRKIVLASGAVTTIAGGTGSGFADATGTSALFNFPIGITADNSGNLYVADSSNNRIRKIVHASGVVTTIAGVAGSGTTDATGTNAMFSGPAGVSFDNNGNLYISDTNNNRIRKLILSSNAVTTVAGSSFGFADGNGTSAAFYNPYAIAADANGNIVVADRANHRIRLISTGSSNAVSTLAGNNTF